MPENAISKDEKLETTSFVEKTESYKTQPKEVQKITISRTLDGNYFIQYSFNNCH